MMVPLFLAFAMLSMANAQFGIGGSTGAASSAGSSLGGASPPAAGGDKPPAGGALPGASGGLPGAGGGLPGAGGLPTPPIAVPTVPSVSLPGLDICAPFKLGVPGLKADILDGACNMANGWLKGFQGVKDMPLQYRTILTADQKKYWDSVVNCRSVQCICDYWPKCRRFTANLASGGKANITEILYYSNRYGRVTRKDIRAMTDVERRRFFYALNKLKNTKIDGWSKFDILTAYHFFVPFTPAAHFTASMLPFHRNQINVLEIALRFEHPLATFPMWDPTLDTEMNNPRDTVLWTEELMGSGDGNVTDGPFYTWKGDPNPNFPAPLYQGGIYRAAGLSQKGILFTKEHVDIIMAKPLPQLLVFCTDPFLDTVHAATHIYIGGLMADPATSPGEPLFYLLHCFIDSIWERWREKHQTRDKRPTDLPLPCPYNPFDLPDMQMFPYPIKVKDGYSNVYTDEFYQYQEPPTCANKCYDSKYLVCNPKNGRCMSKARKSGDCSGFESLDVCYKGKCQGGKCVAS